MLRIVRLAYFPHLGSYYYLWPDEHILKLVDKPPLYERKTDGGTKMENATVLKDGRRANRNFLVTLSELTIPQIAACIMCFVFSRASIFEVIRPFVPAFYVSFGFTGVSKVLALFAMTLGNLLFSNFYEAMRQSLSILLFEASAHLIFNGSKRRETAVNRAALMAILVGITGVLRGLVQGMRIYDLIASILCAAFVFSLSVIIAPAFEAFRQQKQKFSSCGRAQFARAVLVGIGVISLKGLTVSGCDIGTVLAGLAVLAIARRKGSSVGALLGALLGAVVAMYDIPSSLEIPGMFALAGAAAGLPVRTKTASVILWTSTVIVFSGLSVLRGDLVIIYYEALAAGIVFFVTPASLLNILGDKMAGDGQAGFIRGAETARLPEFDHEAADRLFVLSKVLSRVSRNIEELVSGQAEEEGTVTDWMIETVAEKVCNRCSMCDRCWETQFLKTYKMVEKSISDLKADDTGKYEIPAWFRQACKKSEKFFENLVDAYFIYKTENIWRIKLSESRMLMARQAKLISGGILTAARAMLDVSGRDYDLEGMLLTAANSGGIPVSGFRYHVKPVSKPYLEAIFKSKDRVSPGNLDEIVRQTLQNDFIRVGETRRDMMGYSVVRYLKQPKFKTATGVARASREKGRISGDNFAFFISADGCQISAVSDGTGSGKKAEYYSRAAIQMLENFVDDGLEISQVIRFLNLFLELKGENERLATMDICTIDLSTGAAFFYKVGAPASFIKRKQEVVPVEGKPETMAAGDFVIMFSDGILEAFSPDGGLSELQKYLGKIDTVNAQQMADAILQEALSLSKENHDDMLVLVTKVW